MSKGRWTYDSFAWLEVDSRPYKERCCILIRRRSWFDKVWKKFGDSVLDEGTTAGNQRHALQPACDGLYLEAALNDSVEDDITKLLSEIRRLRSNIPPPPPEKAARPTRRSKTKPKSGRALPLGSRVGDKAIYDTEWEFREWFEDNLGCFGFRRIILSQETCPDYVVESESGDILRVEAELFASNFIDHGHDPKKVDRIVACFSAENQVASIPVLFVNDLRVYSQEAPCIKETGAISEELSEDERRVLGIIMFTGGIELSALAQQGFAGDKFIFRRVSPELIKGIARKRIQDSLLQVIGPRTRTYISRFQHVLLGGGLSDGLCEALSGLQKKGLIELRPLPFIFAIQDGILIDHDGWVPTEVHATDDARSKYGVRLDGQLFTRHGEEAKDRREGTTSNHAGTD